MKIGQKTKEILAGIGLIALAAGSVWLGLGKAGEESHPQLYLALLWGLSGLVAFAGVDAMLGARISGLIFRGRDGSRGKIRLEAEKKRKLAGETKDEAPDLPEWSPRRERGSKEDAGEDTE